MGISANIYIAGNSSIHSCDARIKVLLLLAYTVTLFFVQTWAGLFVCAVLCVAASVDASIPAKRMLLLLSPVFVILAFTIIFNSFALDVAHGAGGVGLGAVSSPQAFPSPAGAFADAPPVPLVGTFGFVPAGFARGCFYALRIVLLVGASLVVSFTTTSNDLTNALNDFLKPLKPLHVPTEDIAMMVSIALRFIPLTADELSLVRAAQWSRGAAFDTGGARGRIRAWQTVLIPMFVGLFRRADNLAIAMDARCYGMAETRSELHPRPLTAASLAILTGGIGALVLLAYFL